MGLFGDQNRIFFFCLKQVFWQFFPFPEQTSKTTLEASNLLSLCGADGPFGNKNSRVHNLKKKIG